MVYSNDQISSKDHKAYKEIGTHDELKEQNKSPETDTKGIQICLIKIFKYGLKKLDKLKENMDKQLNEIRKKING